MTSCVRTTRTANQPHALIKLDFECRRLLACRLEIALRSCREHGAMRRPHRALDEGFDAP